MNRSCLQFKGGVEVAPCSQPSKNDSWSGPDLLHVDLIESGLDVLAHRVQVPLWIRATGDGASYHLLGDQLSDCLEVSGRRKSLTDTR
jgi:hypothetical protein